MKKTKKIQVCSAVALALLLSGFTAGAGFAVDTTELFQRTQRELEKNKPSEQTVNDLQAVVQAEPTNSQAHLHLGLCLDIMGLTDAAAEQFEQAVKYGANNPELLVTLVKTEIKAGRIQPAMAILNEGVKKFPNNAEMLYLIGDYLYHQKNVGDARTVLERAYQIDPEIPGLATSLGNALLEVNPMRAAQLASKELEKRPGYEVARYVRGFAYKKMGRYREAAHDLQIVFEKQPLLPPVLESLSYCYYWLGDYDKALKPAAFLSAATAFNNVEVSGTLPNLVKIMVKVKRDTLVEKMAKIDAELIMRGYVRPEFYYVLGKAYDQLDMPNAAMMQYKRCIALEPGNARAYFRLGLNQELYSRDYKAAMESYQQAYNLRPWDQEITVAYLRLQDRLHNRNSDIAWKWKDWLNKTFNIN